VSVGVATVPSPAGHSGERRGTEPDGIITAGHRVCSGWSPTASGLAGALSDRNACRAASSGPASVDGLAYDIW